ncbi:MAG TPA: hypothetical protein ENK02_12265 [Planctomycetes bacterium]|nr:hypothetical protein [Planctomycetota bacterium]
MAKKRLPRGVSRSGAGYRAWVFIDGKKIYGPTRTTPKEAGLDAMKMRAKKEKLPQRLMTLKDGMDLLIQRSEKRLSKHTMRWYRGHFKILLEAWDPGTPLIKITPADIERFVEVRLTKVSGMTVRKDLRALSRIFTIAMKQGYALENPVSRVDPPRVRTPKRQWFTRDEIVSILERIRSWEPNSKYYKGETGHLADADLIELAWHTGARWGELSRVEVKDIDFNLHRIWIRGKCGDRELPINDQCTEVLKRMVGDREDGPLIPGGPEEISRRFKRWRLRLDEPRLNARALRHSFGSHLAASGIPPATVANLMGHTSLAMAMKYFHTSGKDAQAALHALTLPTPPKGPSASSDSGPKRS